MAPRSRHAIIVVGAAMLAGCALGESADKVGERLRRECVSILDQVARADMDTGTREALTRRCIIVRGGIAGVL
jgi:hypothetical protein